MRCATWHGLRLGVALVLILALVSACAGMMAKPDGTQRSPRELAELSFATTAIGYEFGQDVIVSARRNGHVTDGQWSRFDQAQHAVAQYTPSVRAMLDLWRETGEKPESYDAAAMNLAKAMAEIVAVRAEVQR